MIIKCQYFISGISTCSLDSEPRSVQSFSPYTTINNPAKWTLIIMTILHEYFKQKLTLPMRDAPANINRKWGPGLVRTGMIRACA